MTPAFLRRILGALLLGAAFAIAVATLRMFLDGREAFDEGQKLADAGETLRAAAAFENAARSYVPGSPYPDAALDKLSIMARAAEIRGDSAISRRLWEIVRRSILSTRHVVQPNENLLERAESELQRLDAAAFTERHEGTLRTGAVPKAPRPRDPSPLASLLLFAGLLSWIAGAAWLCAVAQSEKHVRSRRAAWITSVLGLALWLCMAFFAG